MKSKILSLTLFCFMFLTGAALADTVHFTAYSINGSGAADNLYGQYKIYTTGDGSTGTGVGNRYLYEENMGKWDADNFYFQLTPNSSRSLHFDEVSAEGVVLESLIFEKAVGTILFTYSGGDTSSITIDQVYDPGSDLIALFGDLIDYSLGGIMAITYSPAAGSYPNNALSIYEMSYSTYGSSAVPVPGAVWLVGTGLAGLVACRRKLAK